MFNSYEKKTKQKTSAYIFDLKNPLIKINEQQETICALWTQLKNLKIHKSFKVMYIKWKKK